MWAVNDRDGGLFIHLQCDCRIVATIQNLTGIIDLYPGWAKKIVLHMGDMHILYHNEVLFEERYEKVNTYIYFIVLHFTIL